MSDDSCETSRIRGFDALRAISVLLVILSHTGVLGRASDAAPILAAAVSVFNANFGVKTFFVLSGFLITSLLIAEHREAGRVDIPAFMLRRALRILPLYVVILTLAVVLMCLGIARPAWTAALYSLFYVYNFLPHANEVNYLNHLWSLSVEEQFYILWPFVFGLAKPVDHSGHFANHGWIGLRDQYRRCVRVSSQWHGAYVVALHHLRAAYGHARSGNRHPNRVRNLRRDRLGLSQSV